MTGVLWLDQPPSSLPAPYLDTTRNNRPYWLIHNQIFQRL